MTSSPLVEWYLVSSSYTGIVIFYASGRKTMCGHSPILCSPEPPSRHGLYGFLSSIPHSLLQYFHQRPSLVANDSDQTLFQARMISTFPSGTWDRRTASNQPVAPAPTVMQLCCCLGCSVISFHSRVFDCSRTRKAIMGTGRELAVV